MHVGPLNSISAALLQGIAETVTYQHVAEDLLRQAVTLDEISRHAIVSGFGDIDDATETLTLDPNRIKDPDAFLRAQEVFDKVRSYVNHLGEQIPLLEDVLSKLDYWSHSMSHVFHLFDQTPRVIGYIHNVQRNHISYEPVERFDVRYALQHYLGLAPDPVFGSGIAYTDPQVIDTLTPFGFGVTVYLNIALNPDLIAEGRLPSRFEFGRISRPVTPAPVTVESDGTIRLAAV